MAREGALAVLTDALELVHKTAKSINDNAHKAVSFKMDVTEPTEVNYLAEKVLEQFCKVDRLVNNAGVLKLAPLVGMVVEVRDKMIKVNIKRIPIVTKAVLPSMLKRKYGRTVNSSSVTGPLVADIGETTYAATKAAVCRFTRALALEVARDGMTVNAICPGMIEADMVRTTAVETNPDRPQSAVNDLARRIPTGRLGTMEELGELVTFLASDEARYTTGTPVLIDGRNTLPESGVFTLA